MRLRQRNFRLALLPHRPAPDQRGCASCRLGSRQPGARAIRARTQRRPPTPPADAARFAFAGTAWRLVEILSMDDSVFTPRIGRTTRWPSPPTAARRCAPTAIAAPAHGRRRDRTSCSSAPSPPPGRSARPARSPTRYLAQFEWIRSYVTRDGHLFLATMADGAIIEFEPVAEP